MINDILANCMKCNKPLYYKEKVMELRYLTGGLSTYYCLSCGNKVKELLIKQRDARL